MREEDRELVTADAEGAVGTAQGVVQHGAEAAEDAIAVGMATRVVDRLEVVDVDEKERQRDVVAQGGRDLPIELLVEGAVVAQPGERVAQRIGQGRLVANLELGLRRHQGANVRHIASEATARAAAAPAAIAIVVSSRTIRVRRYTSPKASTPSTTPPSMRRVRTPVEATVRTVARSVDST